MERGYPSAEEFRRLLLREPLDAIFDRYLLRGTPYVFRTCPERLQDFREHLAHGLGTSPDRILVVGSAKVGFSLDPNAFPRRFLDSSDVDVLVYDRDIFDRVWMSLLVWHYQGKSERLYRPDRDWARKRRRAVYLGRFEPLRMRYSGLSFPKSLVPLRDLYTAWFNAFQSLSVLPDFATRRASGRLYRTLNHGRLYHVDGLRQIRDSLQRT